MPMGDPDRTVLAATRRSWHGVGELVLAGPQYRRSGTIRLRAVPGGFGTVREPALTVSGTSLVAVGRVEPIDGRTLAELGAAVGVDVGAPQGLYHDGSGVPADEPLTVDAGAAAHLAACLAVGDAALRAFAAGTVDAPVLWPEHFDVVAVCEDRRSLMEAIEPVAGRRPDPGAVRVRRAVEVPARRVLERSVRCGPAGPGAAHGRGADPVLRGRPAARGCRSGGLTRPATCGAVWHNLYSFLGS